MEDRVPFRPAKEISAAEEATSNCHARFDFQFVPSIEERRPVPYFDDLNHIIQGDDEAPFRLSILVPSPKHHGQR